jgi:hypothetical protein
MVHVRSCHKPLSMRTKDSSTHHRHKQETTQSIANDDDGVVDV